MKKYLWEVRAISLHRDGKDIITRVHYRSVLNPSVYKHIEHPPSRKVTDQSLTDLISKYEECDCKYIKISRQINFQLPLDVY